MGRYVERDGAGAITGVFTMPQRKDQEFLEDGHADLAAVGLREERRARREAIDAEMLRRNAAGFMHEGRRYQIDEAAQGRITSLAVLAAQAPQDWPDDFAFIAADNEAVPFRPSEFTRLAAAAALAVIRRRRRARVLKDAILAASDARALAAIDITTGWE